MHLANEVPDLKERVRTVSLCVYYEMGGAHQDLVLATKRHISNLVSGTHVPASLAAVLLGGWYALSSSCVAADIPGDCLLQVYKGVPMTNSNTHLQSGEVY